MGGELQQRPVELVGFVPFVPLAKFAAHEQQFFTGMRILPGIEQPQIGKALPGIARHLVEHASFHVHDFVVRQRQYEVLSPRIHLAKGQLVVLKLAVDRLLFDVGQAVVHPAHVPLHRETQPAQFDRARHRRPRGRLFRDGQYAGETTVHFGVHFAQEMNGLDVLAPAVLVRQPFAVLARIVQIQHRCDRIDTQPVDVKFVQPVQRVGHQKIAHLVTAKIENQRTPVLMLTPAWIGVLVYRLAGKARQREIILGEMPRYPVKQDTDTGLMAGIDKRAKTIGRSKARRRCVITRHLIAP